MKAHDFHLRGHLLLDLFLCLDSVGIRHMRDYVVEPIEPPEVYRLSFRRESHRLQAMGIWFLTAD